MDRKVFEEVPRLVSLTQTLTSGLRLSTCSLLQVVTCQAASRFLIIDHDNNLKDDFEPPRQRRRKMMTANILQYFATLVSDEALSVPLNLFPQRLADAT